MNAKEISDSTLESVTPADNDLLIIYDTSEGTTGKATIADIAPKVAENIDIATLPAVTPAADDVLMIGDTSAGTIGKSTISDIVPKVKGGIVNENEEEGDELDITNYFIKRWTGKNVSELLFPEELLVTISGQVSTKSVEISRVLIEKMATGAYRTTVISSQESYTVNVNFEGNEFREIAIIHGLGSFPHKYILTAEIINQ